MTKLQYRDFVKVLFKNIAIDTANKLLHYNLEELFLHLRKRETGTSESFGHSYCAAHLNMFLFKQDFETEIIY